MFFPAYFLPSGGKGGGGIRDFTKLQVAVPVTDFWGFNPWGRERSQGQPPQEPRKMRGARGCGDCAAHRLPAPRAGALGSARRPGPAAPAAAALAGRTQVRTSRGERARPIPARRRAATHPLRTPAVSARCDFRGLEGPPGARISASCAFHVSVAAEAPSTPSVSPGESAQKALPRQITWNPCENWEGDEAPAAGRCGPPSPQLRRALLRAGGAPGATREGSGSEQQVQPEATPGNEGPGPQGPATGKAQRGLSTPAAALAGPSSRVWAAAQRAEGSPRSGDCHAFPGRSRSGLLAGGLAQSRCQ